MTFSIYLQNSRSIRGKTIDFRHGLSNSDYDVVGIAETWLYDGVYDGEVSDSRYDVHRCDRDLAATECTRGGGVMLLTRRSLAARRDDSCLPTNPLFDIVHIIIPAKTVKLLNNLHIICVYLPGTRSANDSILSQFNQFLSKITDQFPNDYFVWMGDFNMSSVVWSADLNEGLTASGNISGDIQEFTELLYLSGLNQHNGIANGNGSFLDLVISNTYVSVTRCNHPFTREDMPHHPALELQLPNISIKPLKETPTKKYIFGKADYDSIRAELRNIDWNLKLKNNTSLDGAVENFYTVLYNLRDRFVPTYVKIHNDLYPNWYSLSLINIIKEKLHYHKLWKKFNNPRDYDSFSLLRTRQKETQEECWDRYISKCESALTKNPKYFWKYTKDLKKCGSIPRQMMDGSVVVTDAVNICERFLNYFQSVYRDPSVTTNPNVPDTDTTSDNYSGIHFTEEIVLKYLKNIDINKGPGSDGIPPLFVKTCSKELALPLSIIFNRSLAEGIFPARWKEAIVVPVHKNGDRSQFNKYRPVSILSVFSKLFELIVHDYIYPFIEKSVPVQQHGFMRGRSVTSNLAIFTNSILKSMDGGGQMDVIYTDYSKCFDRLEHSILLQKLSVVGVHGDLLRWFASYLENRSQAVRIGTCFSKFATIPSGVPQGSHLGPLLFNIYVSDISTCFHHTQFSMYADDMKIFSKIYDLQDCLKVQEDLSRLVDYCKLNLLDLNVDKCQCITYSRKRSVLSFCYTINDVPVDRRSEVRDLGVILDHKLSFTSHYEHIVQKAYKMLGFIMRITKPFKRIQSLKALYFAYVRSIVEFASQIWSPSYAIHVGRLESIQRRFLKHISHRFGLSLSGYEERLQHYKVLSLEKRRKLSDMMFLYKVLNNGIDCPELVESIGLNTPTTRTRHTRLFFEPRSQNNYARNSIVSRCVRTYNDSFQHLDIFHLEQYKYKSLVCDVLSGNSARGDSK